MSQLFSGKDRQVRKKSGNRRENESFYGNRNKIGMRIRMRIRMRMRNGDGNGDGNGENGRLNVNRYGNGRKSGNGNQSLCWLRYGGLAGR